VQYVAHIAADHHDNFCTRDPAYRAINSFDHRFLDGDFVKVFDDDLNRL